MFHPREDGCLPVLAYARVNDLVKLRDTMSESFWVKLTGITRADDIEDMKFVGTVRNNLVGGQEYAAAGSTVSFRGEHVQTFRLDGPHMGYRSLSDYLACRP